MSRKRKDTPALDADKYESDIVKGSKDLQRLCAAGHEQTSISGEMNRRQAHNKIEQRRAQHNAALIECMRKELLVLMQKDMTFTQADRFLVDQIVYGTATKADVLSAALLVFRITRRVAPDHSAAVSHPNADCS